MNIQQNSFNWEKNCNNAFLEYCGWSIPTTFKHSIKPSCVQTVGCMKKVCDLFVLNFLIYICKYLTRILIMP
jgi:hypothetical protein